MIEHEDPRLKKIVYAWDVATLRDKDTIKLEDLCAAADIPPDEFLGLIIPGLWRRNLDIGKLIAAMAHPQVIQASIEMAQHPHGTQDRQMLHQASGFLPTKSGTSISIDNRKQVLNAGGVGSVKDTSAPGLPSFEQDAIEGAETLRGDAGANSVQKRLPAPRESQNVSVPAVIDAEVVES